MKATILLLLIVIFKTRAWTAVRNPFEFLDIPTQQSSHHIIPDCMHVVSEEGSYTYKKSLHLSSSRNGIIDLEKVKPSMTVCGLYVITDPDKIIEVEINYLDVLCETGGLMAFVDGWELNGQYFPNTHDHQIDITKRVDEFCNNQENWGPYSHNKKVFRSSQNAALIQYRIPIRGAFTAHVRFISNPKPCHILTDKTEGIYLLTNHGMRNNCTLTAIYPVVVAVKAINVGRKITLGANYECETTKSQDKLEVGGSSGIDSHEMAISSVICGHTDKLGPEQAIFCGATTVRLTSSGNYNNEALISLRLADENDLNIATLMCDI